MGGSLVGSLWPLWGLFWLGGRWLGALFQASSLLGCLDLSQEGHGGLASLWWLGMGCWGVRSGGGLTVRLRRAVALGLNSGGLGLW